MNNHKYIKAALNEKSETFVVYRVVLKALKPMIIYFSQAD